MLETEQPQVSSQHQIEELLGEPDFLRIIELMTRRVMRSWNIPGNVARGLVFSAIGEPKTLACVHGAWSLAKHSGDSFGLAKLIIRRRVIDLLRKDARQANHSSLPSTPSAIDAEGVLDPSFHDLVQRSPRVQLELRQIIQMVRAAVTCFEAQGQAQRRQGLLLRRYALDDVTYAELAMELASTEGALRVRVHKAMIALKKHIQECHPDLEDLLERDRRPSKLADHAPAARASGGDSGDDAIGAAAAAVYPGITGRAPGRCVR